MDAIFVFGDRIAQDKNGRLYTGTSFSQEIFDRYLEHFDHFYTDDAQRFGRFRRYTGI